MTIQEKTNRFLHLGVNLEACFDRSISDYFKRWCMKGMPANLTKEAKKLGYWDISIDHNKHSLRGIGPPMEIHYTLPSIQ